MEMRQLGNHGPRVSAIGLGCMPMSGTYGSASDADGIATIHRALEVVLTDEDGVRLDALAADAQGERYGPGSVLPNWVSPRLG